MRSHAPGTKLCRGHRGSKRSRTWCRQAWLELCLHCGRFERLQVCQHLRHMQKRATNTTTRAHTDRPINTRIYQYLVHGNPQNWTLDSKTSENGMPKKLPETSTKPLTCAKPTTFSSPRWTSTPTYYIAPCGADPHLATRELP